TSRGPVPPPCPEARSQCRVATDPSAATRRRGGASDEDLHLPRLQPPGHAAAPPRWPPDELLRPGRAQRADRAPGARPHRAREGKAARADQEVERWLTRCTEPSSCASTRPGRWC